uniref:Uncharacterized protein n=1 Tax=Globodera rostochiensis TaxID=31243 RepID=A0A914HD25_GLORO
MAFFLCVLFFGTILRNGAAASSGNGHFAQQQLPGYFTYGGGPNDDTRRMDSESDQRRQQQLGRTSRRHSSDHFSQQRPQMSDNQQRKPGGWSFGEKDKCQERCELDCFTFPFTDMGDTIKEFEQPRLIWICTQLKPPSRPFHEKIVNHVTNASLFEYVIFGVVLMAVIVCFVCGCYQCCCRQNPHDGRHSSRSFIEERNTDCSNFANHFGAQTKSNHAPLKLVTGSFIRRPFRPPIAHIRRRSQRSVGHLIRSERWRAFECHGQL